MTTEITKPELTDTSSLRRSDVAKEIAISAVKSVIGVVPWIGQALNEALFDCRGRIKQERLNAFFSDLAVRVEQLGEEKIDKKYIATDEFSDFIEQIAKRVADNRNQKKRFIYSSLLLSGIQGIKPPDLSETFLDILGELSEAELHLFSKLHQMHRERMQQDSAAADYLQDGVYWYFTSEKVAAMGMDYSDFLTLIQSMIRKGLLFDSSASYWGRSPHSIIRISEVGVRFYEYITSE